MLKRTLWSIEQQHYPHELIEIIVVSQTPQISDETLSNSLAAQLQVFVRPSSDTISALRNFGVKHAKGDYLAFLDADIELSANWIEHMVNQLNMEKRIIVSAMQIANVDAPPLEIIRTELSNVELDCNVAFLPGRNLFMLRSSFDVIGDFPEHLITCEDYYFTDKAARLGPLYYSSGASYIHLGEDKQYTEMFKKELWRGQSNLQSIKGRSIPLREIPSFVLPLWIVGCFLLSLLITVFAQASEIAGLLLVLALLPLMAYSLRLFSVAKNKVRLHNIVKFYLYYFPARAIGTVVGLFKSINANHK